MNPHSTSATLFLRLGLTCAFILGTSPSPLAAPEDFYKAHLQTGVKMGMSQEELAKARPAARSVDMSGFDRPAGGKPPGPPAEMAEFRRGRDRGSFGRDRGSFSGYRFKEGKLCAVTEATLVATKMGIVPIEQTQAAVSKLTEELKASFILKAQDQIVRSGGLEWATLLTAQLWEDKTSGLHLYFVATNHGIEIVLFDPKVFAKTDFFAGAETLEESKADMESIRRQHGDRADPPRPLIDLLAKPATEKK